MSRIFSNPLIELAEFEELSRDIARKKGPVQVSGCMDSQKVHLMAEAEPDMPWKLVVTYDAVSYTHLDVYRRQDWS